MLDVRPDQIADDGHCQFRAIGGTVFGDSSLTAALMIRKNPVIWILDNYDDSVKCMLRGSPTKEELLHRL